MAKKEIDISNKFERDKYIYAIIIIVIRTNAQVALSNSSLVNYCTCISINIDQKNKFILFFLSLSLFLFPSFFLSFHVQFHFSIYLLSLTFFLFLSLMCCYISLQEAFFLRVACLSIKSKRNIVEPVRKSK